MFDLNDAGTQTVFGDLIPDGTFCKIKFHLKDGGIDGSGPHDKGLLKASKSSDAKMLDAELTVVDGPFAKRKIFQMFTVSGGSVDEKGVSKGWKITKPILRAMIDSCVGLRQDDMSDAAQAKRVLKGMRDLEGLTFVAKIAVEPGQAKPDGTFYNDKNTMERVIVPGDSQYADVMAGKPVAAEPSNRKRPTASAVAPQAQTWGAPPAAAPAAQSWSGAPAAQAPAAGPAWLNG